MHRTRYTVAVLLALAVYAALAAIAFARTSGSPASRTGAVATGTLAAESNCTSCHSGTANVNGSVSVNGVPAVFEPNTTYTLTVTLASTQTTGSASRVWGFQLTAIDAATGAGAGTFTITNPAQTALVSGSSSFATRRYVNHISGGVQSGAASPVSWTVNWTSPALGGSSGVVFYSAGLAGNGNGSSSGDYTYTGSLSSVMDLATPAQTTSWGALKAKFRR